MTDTLDDVYDALEELKATSSRNLKEEKLKIFLGEIPWLCETIFFALNNYMQYNTNRVNFVEPVDGRNVGDIFTYLQSMADKRGVSHQNIRDLSVLASKSEKTVEVVKRIVNKDLKCGVQASTANKCGMDIPIYKVMKAIGDNPFPGKEWPKFVELCGGFDKICWAIKADGFRTSYIKVQETGEVEYLSSAGKPFLGFSIFDDEMRDLANFCSQKHGIRYPMKFDGEFVSKDGDFQKVQKMPRTAEKVDASIYRLLIWDVLTDGFPVSSFIHRYSCLNSLVETTGEIYDLLEKVSYHTNTLVFRLKHNFVGFKDTQAVIDETRRVIADGCEGLVFKTPHHEHEFKRSKHWFKLKSLYLSGEGVEEDLPVIGFEYGRPGTRLETMLGKFVCDYNGVEVRVSGKLSDKQRIEYVKNLPSYITVHADSITDDGSLRLPIFQHVRKDM